MGEDLRAVSTYSTSVMDACTITSKCPILFLCLLSTTIIMGGVNVSDSN